MQTIGYLLLIANLVMSGVNLYARDYKLACVSLFFAVVVAVSVP